MAPLPETALTWWHGVLLCCIGILEDLAYHAILQIPTLQRSAGFAGVSKRALVLTDSSILHIFTCQERNAPHPGLS